MKLISTVFCFIVIAASARAQLIPISGGLIQLPYGSSPITGPGSDQPVPILYGFQHVQVGSLLGGQTVANLGTISSLTTGMAEHGGPYFREEYISGPPSYIHGPPVIDFANPISLVFDIPVEGVGITVVHRFGSEPATFPAGQTEIFAFDTLGTLIGTYFSTSTSGTYTDPSTWELMAFQTADQTASIKAITIYDVSFGFGIAPAVRYRYLASFDPSPVPEPSTYGLAGATALLAVVLMHRKRAA